MTLDLEKQQALAETMKLGLRHLASGVSVVASRDGAGVPHAMTVTSITSVSDAPPSLLICLNDSSSVSRSLATTDFFSASLLKLEQRDLSDRCAFSPEEGNRFTHGDWRDFGDDKTPYLHDALASFICRVKQKTVYGTHWIVVGDIEEVFISGEEVSPLVYCRATYSGFADGQ